MQSTATPAPIRFKIDVCSWNDGYYAVYRVRGYSFWSKKPEWRHLKSFMKREDAKAFYEQVKDLPEYLA